jgi:4-hydroxy-L-threonine phosphate dehydrogenase PdxA
MSDHRARPTLLITLGDPCGIGPELLLRSLPAINRWANVVVVGARAGVGLLEPTLNPLKWRWDVPVMEVPTVPGAEVFGLWTTQSTTWEDADRGLSGQATWIDPTPSTLPSHLDLGVASAEGGRCALEAVRVGARLATEGRADALVTLPLSKAAVHLAGFFIPGHTELLRHISGAALTRMAFVSPSLSVVLHTVHQSMRSMLDELGAEAVAETLAFSADRFAQLTGKSDLRVALCGLNPHAGEAGAFGREEEGLREALGRAETAYRIHPEGPYAHLPSPFPPGPAPQNWAIFHPQRRRFSPLGGTRQPAPAPPPAPGKTGPSFTGPHPADTVFLNACRGDFDLVVALYHDQGLIPIKVLEPNRAVNLTLGLPFIRTSPDHGTAFALAGKWEADPTNFLEATALAVRLAGRSRQEAWDAEVTGQEAEG